MVCTMSVASAAIGMAIVSGFIAKLPLEFRLSAFSFLAFLALFGFYHGMRYRKPIQIDITADGQLRLAEVFVAGSCTTTDRLHVRDSAEVVRLSEDSTIWPRLLLLRLRSDSGEIKTVPVLPDCVSQQSFRALSVAIRWIAAHNISARRNDF